MVAASRCPASVRHPDWVHGGGPYHVGCDYRLMIDNVMDLTHETYVHATSIGQPEIEEAPVATSVDGDHVVTSRHMENMQAAPFWRTALRGNGLADDVSVDRWQICHFDPRRGARCHQLASLLLPRTTHWRTRRSSWPSGQPTKACARTSMRSAATTASI